MRSYAAPLGCPTSGGPRWLLIGELLVGWDAFKVVEGIVDHYLLRMLHLKETANHLAWDLGFLA